MFCYFDAISTSDKQIDATLTYTNVENLLDPEEGGGYLGKCGPYRTYIRRFRMYFRLKLYVRCSRHVVKSRWY